MTVDDVEALFSEAYDGLLEPDEQRAFEAKLTSDPALAARYAAFRETLELLKSSQVESSATPDLLAGVQRRLRDKSGGRFYADRFAERTGWASRQLFIVLVLSACALGLLWLLVRLFWDLQLAS